VVPDRYATEANLAIQGRQLKEAQSHETDVIGAGAIAEVGGLTSHRPMTWAAARKAPPKEEMASVWEQKISPF
jgi:hypothetical protein